MNDTPARRPHFVRRSGDEELELRVGAWSVCVRRVAREHDEDMLRGRDRGDATRHDPARPARAAPTLSWKRPGGLLAETYRAGAKPYERDCVLFVRSGGQCLISRRFEGGRQSSLLAFAEEATTKSVTTGKLTLLLEATRFTVHKRARAWRADLPPALSAVVTDRPILI
jgi:hypothetical protein